MFLLASTMIVLVYCAELHNDNTYHDVLRSMCGKRTQQMAAFSIMSTCFGINVTFLIIIGDQFDTSMFSRRCLKFRSNFEYDSVCLVFKNFIGPGFADTFWLNRNFTIGLCTVLFIWPICYFKRLDFLRYVRYGSRRGVFENLD